MIDDIETLYIVSCSELESAIQKVSCINTERETFLNKSAYQLLAAKSPTPLLIRTTLLALFRCYLLLIPLN